MTDRNDIDPAEPVLLSALLTPHRSLNRTGFIVLMCIFGGMSFATGIVFLVMGAWPVLGFLGLDVLIVYWAFRINFRRARAYEEIRITPSELNIRRVSHRGHQMEWTLNPLWVKLETIEHEEYGTERLYLVSRGSRISIGRFLGPDEKASFHNALSAALNAAKRGPVLNPVP
jgi:uncharacterized membrane protein